MNNLVLGRQASGLYRNSGMNEMAQFKGVGNGTFLQRGLLSLQYDTQNWMTFRMVAGAA